jgi:hypothetical protein
MEMPPINIIMNTTPKRSMAVEKFSKESKDI